MTITFRRDGRRIESEEGRSIAAALWAHGDRVLSRSLKFHRPRGFFCGTGKCNQCMMRVDGVPNVKTCMTEAREGTVVEGQNAWPSVRRDALRASDATFRHGFDHHRAFLRPRPLYPLFSKVIRAFAGWGRLPDAAAPKPRVETVKADVLVIGGGPAGLAAGVAAATSGAATLLFDERRRLGGAAALLGGETPDPEGGDTRVSIRALADQWVEEARTTKGLTLHAGMAVSAVYREGLVLAQTPARLLAVAPRAIVVAGGAHEAQALFEGNDIPGIMTATGCLMLLHDDVLPGTAVVVYGGGPHGVRVAETLAARGLPVVAVVAPTPDIAPDLRARLETLAVPLWTDARVVRARGRRHLHAVTVMRGGRPHEVRADTLVVALGGKTAPEAFQSMGAELRHDAWQGGAVPVLDEGLQTTVPGLFAAGDCAGVGTLRSARASGRLAGLSAAACSGHKPAGSATEIRRLRAVLDADPRNEGGPMSRPRSVEVVA